MSRKRWSFAMLLAVACLMLLPGISQAHKPGQAKHESYAMGDLKLESGEVIKDFSQSYVTHGTLNKDKSNAVLMTSSLAGNHHRVDFLIGPGKAFDTDKYFIICTDAIGNGLTTSPSNSKVQPGLKFPHFNIRDMVNAEYRLVTEHFGLKKLVAVTGASMGGMQSMQWAVSYPEFMDSIVALSPAAKASAWTVAFMKTANNILMLDPAYKGGAYTQQPEAGWRAWTDFLLAMGANTPQGYEAMYPSDAKDALGFLDWWEKLWLSKKFDANDCIYQQNAIIDHNVGYTPGFGGDYLKALKSIKARVLVFPCRGDVLVPPFIAQEAQYIKNAQVAEVPTLFGHFGASSAYSKADVLFMDSVARGFLEDVTDHGRTLQ